jgi:hypothetical protein
MSQTYYDDCFVSTDVGQVDMAKVETNFAAHKSSFSGASAPSNPVAGMFWFDTTANVLKLRNEANTAWHSIWDFANNRVPDGAVTINSISGLTAAIADINTACDGSTAKNSHTHAASSLTGTMTSGVHGSPQLCSGVTSVGKGITLLSQAFVVPEGSSWGSLYAPCGHIFRVYVPVASTVAYSLTALGLGTGRSASFRINGGTTRNLSLSSDGVWLNSSEYTTTVNTGWQNISAEVVGGSLEAGESVRAYFGIAIYD